MQNTKVISMEKFTEYHNKGNDEKAFKGSSNGINRNAMQILSKRVTGEKTHTLLPALEHRLVVPFL